MIGAKYLDGEGHQTECETRAKRAPVMGAWDSEAGGRCWPRMRRVNRLDQEKAAGKPISLFVVDRLYI
jgi:hypothetical protein